MQHVRARESAWQHGRDSPAASMYSSIANAQPNAGRHTLLNVFCAVSLRVSSSMAAHSRTLTPTRGSHRARARRVCVWGEGAQQQQQHAKPSQARYSRVAEAAKGLALVVLRVDPGNRWHRGALLCQKGAAKGCHGVRAAAAFTQPTRATTVAEATGKLRLHARIHRAVHVTEAAPVFHANRQEETVTFERQLPFLAPWLVPNGPLRQAPRVPWPLDEWPAVAPFPPRSYSPGSSHRWPMR